MQSLSKSNFYFQNAIFITAIFVGDD